MPGRRLDFSAADPLEMFGRAASKKLLTPDRRHEGETVLLAAVHTAVLSPSLSLSLSLSLLAVLVKEPN
jgi:hypothetical protein